MFIRLISILAPLKNYRKNIVLMICVACWVGCTTASLKLTIPETFKQQATMQHVDGARGNKMTFAHFTTSRIRRGMHTNDERLGRGYSLQNLLLNQAGIQKNETISNEKARFRYTLTDGKNNVEVYANEMQVTRKVEYESFNRRNIFFDKISQVQQYD